MQNINTAWVDGLSNSEETSEGGHCKDSRCFSDLNRASDIMVYSPEKINSLN